MVKNAKQEVEPSFVRATFTYDLEKQTKKQNVNKNAKHLIR